MTGRGMTYSKCGCPGPLGRLFVAPVANAISRRLARCTALLSQGFAKPEFKEYLSKNNWLDFLDAQVLI